MPKQTFYNLPESKRERITQAAIEEFAQYHFHDASINRIIKAANVPRGSFYQYFEDLEDLYKYIVQILAEHKQAKIEENLQAQQQGDIFEVLHEMYQAGLQFAKDHPLFARISNHLFKGDKPFRDKIIGEWEEFTKQYLMDLLKKGQAEGVVRKDIDVEIAAFLLYQQSLTLLDHHLADSDWLLDDTDRSMQMLNEMLKIFAQGIRTEERKIE